MVEADYVFFSEGQLITPLLASCALPPIFSPIRIDGKDYADGGILNNLPVEPVMGKVDVLIGSFVNAPRRRPEKQLRTTFQLMQRSYDLSFYAVGHSRFIFCDYVFLPPGLLKYNLLDTGQIDKIYQKAYDHARSEMDTIWRAIKTVTESKPPSPVDWSDHKP